MNRCIRLSKHLLGRKVQSEQIAFSNSSPAPRHSSMLLNHMPFRHPRCAASFSGRHPSNTATRCRQSPQICRASSSRKSEGSQQGEERWWDGPSPSGRSGNVPEGPVPKMPEELSLADQAELVQGPEEHARWENIRKNERQRGRSVIITMQLSSICLLHPTHQIAQSCMHRHVHGACVDEGCCTMLVIEG